MTECSLSHAGRRWSWAALVWGATIQALNFITLGLAFGFTAFLAPGGAVLTAVAWRRAPHDNVLWVAVTLNVLALLGLIGLLVGLLTGDVGIGLE
jgi:hypothetical protein